MSALALGVIFSIAFGMWLRFAIWDYSTTQQIPATIRPELEELRADPHHNEARLWELFQRYYDVRDFLPGIASRDWLWLASFIMISIPVVILGGVLASRSLSRQFSDVARAARRVAQGDFSVRAPSVPGAPAEIIKLAKDFNRMTAKLEQYEREIRVSSAVLAHELRTPLNAAAGRVQGMLDEVFPSDPQQLMLVKGQLDQLNRLVGDLHLLSLARAGQLAMEKSLFSVSSLVSERLEWASPQLAVANVITQVDVGPELMLLADRDRLGQVLSILIDNLIRYAAQGQCLEIKVSQCESALHLIVADRGLGWRMTS